MDPITGAVLASAGSSLLGGLLGLSGQSSANATNIQLAREQQQWSEAMWNKQNEYNTPAAQMKRLKDAGLNPAMMYSQGQVGNAGSVGSYSRAQVENAMAPLAQGISSAGSGIADLMIRNEQVKQMQAQTEYLKARAAKEANTTPTAEAWQKFFQEKSNLVRNQSQYYDEKQTSQNIFNFMYGHRLDLQARNMDLSNQLLVQQINRAAVEVTLAQEKIHLTKAQTERVIADMDYINLKYSALDQMYPQQYEKLIREVSLLEKRSSWGDSSIDIAERKLRLAAILGGFGLAIKGFSKFVPLKK